jgi:hypothetical protein
MVSPHFVRATCSQQEVDPTWYGSVGRAGQGCGAACTVANARSQVKVRGGDASFSSLARGRTRQFSPRRVGARAAAWVDCQRNEEKETLASRHALFFRSMFMASPPPALTRGSRRRAAWCCCLERFETVSDRLTHTAGLAGCDHRFGPAGCSHGHDHPASEARGTGSRRNISGVSRMVRGGIWAA